MPAVDVDDLLAVQRLDGQAGAERGGGHRHGDPAVQVVALAREHVVRPLVDLDVQVAGRAAARADLALTGQADAHLVLDAGRDLDGQRPAGADPAVTGAGGARVRYHRAVPAAGGARAGRHHLAEERPLDRLHLATAAADVTGGGWVPGGGTGAVAGLAHAPRCPR